MTAPSAHASLADWLEYQERAHPRSIELGLERVGAVASRLGLVPAKIPSIIVAGTNGKGSSATLAASIYREAGYRVGLYTSPHLLRYNERVAVDGRDVDDAELIAAFAAIEAARGGTPLTYFEYGTLAALWLFRARDVQVQVLEVGLGGRLDAVNLINADAALVTSIGIDHTDWLGPDRESIGREKAHVFRAARPAICADTDPPASLLDHAHHIGADLQLAGTAYSFAPAEHGRWTWNSASQTLPDLPAPGLPGEAQLRNAAGVIAMVQALQPRLPVSEIAIRSALPKLQLRGRFECIGRCIFDVAHNADAAEVLAQQLAVEMGSAKVHLVIGMLADKSVETFCAPLAPHVEQAYCASLPAPRGLGSAELMNRMRSTGIRTNGFEDVVTALAAARKAAQTDAGEESWVLVTGSFLTVAAGLQAHG